MDPQLQMGRSGIPSAGFTGLVWSLVFVAAIGVCLFYALTRPIIITSANVSDVSLFDMEDIVPLSLGEMAPAGVVYFTVPDGTVGSDIVTENLYNERRFLIHINSESNSFYGRMTDSGVPLDTGMISGDTGLVKGVGVTYDRTGALLVFDMNRVSEYILTMDENKVYMEAVSPKDMYDFVAVAAPDAGDEAAGVSGDVAERCAILLREKNIKLYIADGDPSKEDTVTPEELMSETDADIYIGIGVSHDGLGHHGVATMYDPLFYIPEFGSVELSECVLKNVVIAASDKALGINAAPFGDILYRINAPATYVTLGNADDSKELDLLREDAYRDRLAKGLFDAVMESYTAMTEEGN